MNEGFKPYYKWNTFNTYNTRKRWFCMGRFKPYYKWNTFNTSEASAPFTVIPLAVLNLIINGIPSILDKEILKGFKKTVKF